jgi:glycosyltransferase involved in cell wall biosynthesis
MKLLTVTNLYPGEDLPHHGLFVEERLRHLAAKDSLDAEVIALRPRAGRGSRKETRHGIDVHYLAVPTLPVVTNWIDPVLWANTVKPLVKEIIDRSNDCVVLDGHFLYPDGVAVTLVARQLGLPVVLTARGSDVNVKCRNAVMRQWVRWAARNSDAVITVSQALKKKLIEIGVEERKMTSLRNGVDLERFSPRLESAPKSTSIDDKFSLLSVGYLMQDKGHHLVIDALIDIQDAKLTIVGKGPDEAALRRQAARVGVEGRVQFAGQVSQSELADYYRAADVTILASAREGMPNVILESLSCGTRVVASDVGGISEVVSAPVAGLLLSERTAAGVAEALSRLRQSPEDRSATRKFAVENLGWAPVIDKQKFIYEEALAH